MRKSQLTDHIYLLYFETQAELAFAFLRFQEHYESPQFKGKVFTLKEFKDWYISNSSGGRETGAFTYYDDWNGFNIPSRILKPFYEGQFGELSPAEQQMLDLFKDETGDFYIIGVHGQLDDQERLLEHEIAHGLFATNPEYKREVLDVLAQFDIEPIKAELRLKSGYHEDVLDDEVHAYSLDSHLETPIPEELSFKIRSVYNKHYR